MPVVRARESAHAIEMAKWEKPYVFEEYPKMLYRARRGSNGQTMVVDPRNESFSAGNTMTVKDENQEERAKREGWRNTQAEAIALFEKGADDLAEAAAIRAAQDAKMSAPAQREAAEAQAQAPHKHLGEIPVQSTSPSRSRCGAKTKAGTQCQFEAGEGGFCKKHSH